MNDYYLKFEKAPALHHPGNPVCANCLEETEYDEGWLCPSCGTSWDAESMEYDEGKGDLYEEWAMEDLSMPVCPPDVAYLISGYKLPLQRLNALKAHEEYLSLVSQSVSLSQAPETGQTSTPWSRLYEMRGSM